MSNHNASTRGATSRARGQFQARRPPTRAHAQIGLALVALALGACGGADEPADAPVVDAGHKTAHKDAGGSGTSGSGNSGTGSATTPATAGTSGSRKDAGAVTPPDKTAADSTWCDVEPLVQTHCQSCHGAKQLYGAPMPLLSATDFQASSKTDSSTTVLAQAKLRLHDATRPMPPSSSPSPQLSSDDLAKLDAWLAEGAPAGSAQSCTAQAGDAGTPASGAPGRALADDDAPWPDDCGEHYTMVASAASGGKVSIGPGQEFYQNVMIAAPWGDKQVQALRFKPLLDNLKVLHHYILYGPDQSFVEGWAPGQAGIIMPPTVGLQLKNGQYRLELHYNNTTGTQAELDGSGLELCVAKTPRPNVAAVHEVGSLSISLPPGQETSVESVCKPTVSKGPVHLIEGHPHMHTKGVHAKTIITRANGKVETMHDAPFSFQEQRKYPLPEDGSATDILINAGDKITYTCTWKNDTNKLVTFGQNTTDEMCFYYIIAWPLGQLVDGSRGPEGDPNACGLGGGLF
jgi:Copper type II ascorbate-dependent monooxygenase, C-terminal domain